MHFHQNKEAVRTRSILFNVQIVFTKRGNYLPLNRLQRPKQRHKNSQYCMGGAVAARATEYKAPEPEPELGFILFIKHKTYNKSLDSLK